jgi:hypothetical protein
MKVSSHFNPKERALSAHWIRGWAGPKPFWTWCQREYSFPCWESNPNYHPILTELSKGVKRILSSELFTLILVRETYEEGQKDHSCELPQFGRLMVFLSSSAC